MKLSSTKLSTLAVACVGLLAIAAPLHAQTLISDSFGGGTSGSPLNGRTTEVGGATWAASSTWLLTATDSVESLGPTGNQAAVVSFATPALGFTLSASLDPVGATGEWTGLGFASAGAESVLTTGMFQANGLFWMLFRDNGDYVVFENGTSNTLASGSITRLAGFNTVSLNYDPVSSLGSVLINSTSVYSGVVSPSAAIVRAGFQGNADNNNIVDNFILSTVPEPSSFVLVAAGLLMLVVVVQRRQEAMR